MVCYMPLTLPSSTPPAIVDVLHPGDDIRTGKGLRVQPLRSHQSNAISWFSPVTYVNNTFCVEVGRGNIFKASFVTFNFNIFLSNKVYLPCLPPHQIWPHKDYPLIKVGKMTLNENPGNYFHDVEQSAFSPANMPPGVEASPDKMLQVLFFFLFFSVCGSCEDWDLYIYIYMGDGCVKKCSYIV